MFTLRKTDFKGVKWFCWFLQFIMFLPFVSAPPLPLCVTTASPPAFSDMLLAFIFILCLFTLLVYIPTENLLFFLYRVWPWVLSLSIRGSRILGNLGGRVRETKTVGKTVSSWQGPLSMCLESSAHQPFQFYFHILTARLCFSVEGNVYWQKTHQILPSLHP